MTHTTRDMHRSGNVRIWMSDLLASLVKKGNRHPPVIELMGT